VRKGIIYKATSPSGNAYIGQTIQGLKLRMQDHRKSAFNKNNKSYNTKLCMAIRKYGFKSFTWEVLIHDVLVCDLNKHERKFIRYYDSFKNGYNGTPGGDGRGRVMSDSTKKKLSLTNKGKKHTKETKEKLSKINSGENAPMFGKKLTKEQIEKFSGEKHGNAKFTWDIVKEIRQIVNEDSCISDLAIRFGVTGSAITKIIFNETWVDINYTAPKYNFTARGEKSGAHKLTKNQVDEIRKKYNEADFSFRDLGEMYDVAKTTVENILNNITWNDPNYKKTKTTNYAHGERRSKLKQEQVDMMRFKYNSTNITYAELGEIYGLSKHSVRAIINNINWYDPNYKKTRLKLKYKLTEKNVFSIRKEHFGGETIKNLANKYNVSKSTIERVISRKTWGHI